MNVSAGERHKGPENGGENGWKALAYELGDGNFLKLLAENAQILSRKIFMTHSCAP